MTKKKLLIIGAGKRVRTTTLPVLEKLEHLCSLCAIYDQQVMTVDSGARRYETEKFENLGNAALKGIDLINVAVNKESVPSVLLRLTQHDVSNIDLLMETPVLLFKHFVHADLLDRFRTVWVAEDCLFLPCFDPVKNFTGELREVEFFHAAYKYHGLALIKFLLGADRIIRGKREKTEDRLTRRRVTCANGRSGRVVEPRDYGRGWFVLSGVRGSLSDRALEREGFEVLAPLLSKDRWIGFKAGDTVSLLDEDEIDLLGSSDPALSITARMDDLKRVALYRLMRDLLEDRGGYPFMEALEDMVIDYYLDRLGFYSANPLMNIRSRAGRLLLRSFTRLLSGWK